MLMWYTDIANAVGTVVSMAHTFSLENEYEKRSSRCYRLLQASPGRKRRNTSADAHTHTHIGPEKYEVCIREEQQH